MRNGNIGLQTEEKKSELELKVNGFIRGREYYNELRFGRSNEEKSATLPFLYSATLFAISSLISNGNKRICVIMPDDKASVIPLVLMDVVHKRMQTEFDPYENLKDIQPGQKMKIGKAVLEVVSISKEAFVFKDATVESFSDPWFYSWYQYLEPVDSSRKLSSHKRLFEEKAKIEELASVNNTIQRLISDRGATTSTTVMLTTKSTLFDYTDDLIISDREFKDVFTIGEFDPENKWYQININNHNIPQITVATEVYKIVECLDDKVEKTIDKFIVTQEKVKELLSNNRTFERLLSLKKPMIVFLSEKDYDKFSVFNKYEFALFHWKPSTLKDVSFRNDGDRYYGTIFENITIKTNNASNARFKLRICSDDRLKAFHSRLKTITNNSRNYDEKFRNIIHGFWNLFREIISNSLPGCNAYLDSLTALEVRWNDIKDNYYDETKETIRKLLDLGSALVCIDTSAKYDYICEEISRVSIDKPIAILLPDFCSYGDKLKAKLLRQFPKRNIDVFRYNDYISKQKNSEMFKTYNELIVTWFEKNEYTQIINTYSYRNIVYILYDFEESWRRKHRNEVNKFLDHKAVVKSMKKIGLKSSAFRDAPFDYKDSDLGTISIDLDNILDYSSALRTIYCEENNTEYRGDEIIQACTVIADNYKINFLPRHKVFEVRDLLSESGGSKNKRAFELEHGDCILVRNSDKDIIADVADELMGSKAKELRELSRLWIVCLKLLIQKYGFDRTCEEMCEGGLCSKQQVRLWSLDEVICPENPNVMTRIADLVRDLDDDDARKFCLNPNKTYAAAKRVISFHVKAGNSLSAALKKRTKDIKELLENRQEGQIAGIGKVMILVVDEVFSNQYVNRNTLNRLEKL